MNTITLVLPYYRNPNMLAEQVRNISHYPGDVLDSLEVIVVDDCSPPDERAERVITQPPPFRFRLFRILTKVAWNWLEARNIGAWNARDSWAWLFMTDIDHLIPDDTMAWAVRTVLDPDSYYTFPRVLYPLAAPYHPHPNTFLIRREDFYEAGCYDEGYAGHYGLGEKTLFSRLTIQAIQSPQPVMLVKRDEIPDASTRDLPRKGGMEPEVELDIAQFKKERRLGVEHMKQPYKEILL